jgi:hydrogenase expression/formation protein HypE
MERVVYTSLGRPSRKLIVGPGRGFDNGVISVGHGRVMILTVDPVSAIPRFGTKLSAWLSVHLIASDYTTSGLDPEFATFSYNFPPTMSTSEREEYLRTVGRECERLGVTIVGGHTGSYPGGGFTVIGAGSMFGFGSVREFVAPSMAREGDCILLTKQAAIEATASLALSFPNYTDEMVGRTVANGARRIISLCSTVGDARTAREVGLGMNGVTSMHDATEGGVLGALEEMAYASRHAFEVELTKIPISMESMKVCRAFGLDPLTTMGEGALLVTCNPDRIVNLRRRMSLANIPITEIGKVKRGEGLLITHGRKKAKKFRPQDDRYWTAYQRAAERGLA